MEQVLLMSIKTKHANKIFEGTKKFEFRRKSIGEKNCNKKIFIYSSEEDKAIIGYIIVDTILNGDINYILKTTNCLDNQDIIKYFKGCSECYALHIGEFHRFLEPLKLEDIRANFEKFVIPQFYRYVKITEPIYEELNKRSKTKELLEE